MAGASISFDLSELAALDGRLAQLTRRGDDMSDLMDAIGSHMEASTRRNFEDEATPEGERWLKSDWARKRTKKTLTEDDHLAGSITHIFGRDSVEHGSDMIYARAHNEGWDEGGLAERRYLGFRPEDEAEITGLTGDFFLEELAA